MRAVAIPVVKDKGKLKVLQPELMRRVTESLKPNRVYHMVIGPKDKEPTVSDPLRRYYFAVVATMIAEETGHSKETIHENMKRRILGIETDDHGIESVPSVFSDQSKLTVKEKQEFIAEVRRWAWDFLNLAIPEPENAVL